MVAKVNVDIAGVAERAKRRLETAVQEVTNDLAETAIRRTPVDTGNLRSHWFVSLNDETASFDTQIEAEAATIGRVSLSIEDAEIGDIISVLNGASYAKFVEFGTVHMAPRAFVRSTVNDAPQIAEQTIRRIAKT